MRPLQLCDRPLWQLIAHKQPRWNFLHSSRFLKASFSCSSHESAQNVTQAEYYSQYSSFSQGVSAELLSEAMNFQSGQTVLDLGCGTGETTVLLGERVGSKGSVIGVDPDSERISIAQRKHKEMLNVSFVAGTSADAVAFGPYDVIFSNITLHWIEKKEADFQNIFKTLKSGGLFGFTTLDIYPEFQNDVLMLQCGPKVENASTTIGLETMDKWLSLCKSAGFFIVSTKEYTQIKQFPTFVHFQKWIYGSTLGRLNPWAMDQNLLFQVLSKHGFSENGPIKYLQGIYQVLAKKPYQKLNK